MLPNDMTIQHMVWDHASFGGVEGSDQQHLSFDHWSESDQEVIF